MNTFLAFGREHVERHFRKTGQSVYMHLKRHVREVRYTLWGNLVGFILWRFYCAHIASPSLGGWETKRALLVDIHGLPKPLLNQFRISLPLPLLLELLRKTRGG